MEQRNKSHGFEGEVTRATLFSEDLSSSGVSGTKRSTLQQTKLTNMYFNDLYIQSQPHVADRLKNDLNSLPLPESLLLTI